VLKLVTTHERLPDRLDYPAAFLLVEHTGEGAVLAEVSTLFVIG
jgi:hypothetical protein